MSNIYRSTKTWSLITIAGLAFVTFFQLSTAFIGAGLALSPEKMIEMGPDDEMSSWVVIFGLVALLQAPVLIATIVVFLIWLNKAYKNLAALRPTYLRFSSGWAVGWWFIPFANLVRPFQVVREVWCESDPEVPQDQIFLTESLHSAPAYMGAWWAFWLLGNFASNILDKFFDTNDPGALTAVGVMMIIASLLTVAAGVLAIRVVSDITRRQAERFVAVSELERQEASARHSAPEVSY